MLKNGKTKNKKSKSLKNGWKILFKYLLEYKSEVILLSVLGVISAIANGTIPYITGRFFDAILTPETVFVGTQIEMPLWLLLIIIFGMVQLVADVMDWINGTKRNYLGMLFFSEYHIKSFARILKYPLEFHNKEKTGSVRERVNRVANNLINLVENVVIRLAPQFLSIFVGLGIVFWINFYLFLILIIGIFLYSITIIKIISPVSELQRKLHKHWGKIFGDYHDVLSNIQTIKQFTTEEYEFKKVKKNFEKDTFAIWGKMRNIWTNISFYRSAIVTIARISIFVISVYLINNNLITIGELIAVNGYSAMVFGPFTTLSNNWQTIQNGLVNLEETEKLLDKPKENYHPQDAVKLEELKGNIEFKNVEFYYNKKDGNVLKGINLKVEAGETVALVGESGVGKSTLIELISAYYFAQKGKVLVDGIDIKKIDLTFLRQNIAVVPQEVSLFNDTIETNIKYGNFKATKEDFEKAIKEADADRFINKFPKKYKQIVGERGVKLSVGQKQRVAIARAILRDPKILILDEPTSALDLETERVITKSLEKLMKGRTTFIVAHRLSTVRQADRIVVFKEGKIIEMGSHKELIKIKDGEYRRLYDLHIGIE